MRVTPALAACAALAVVLAGCAAGTHGTAGVSTAGTGAPGTAAVVPQAAAPQSTSAVAAPAAVPTGVAPTSTAPAAQPKPKPRPRPKNFCAHNTGTQKVIVSIATQHAWMCAHRHDVFDTPVTTGIVGQWTNTPTGNYWIQGRNTNTVLTLNTGAQYDVRYWIPFDAPLFGFHDSSWQDFPYGSPKYKTQGSHGCIHMPLAAMKFLYDWSARPTQVHIA